MLREVYRVLAPDGTYICISHGVPDSRMEFLELVTRGELAAQWFNLVERTELGHRKNHHLQDKESRPDALRA